MAPVDREGKVNASRYAMLIQKTFPEGETHNYDILNDQLILIKASAFSQAYGELGRLAESETWMGDSR